MLRSPSPSMIVPVAFGHESARTSSYSPCSRRATDQERPGSSLAPSGRDLCRFWLVDNQATVSAISFRLAHPQCLPQNSIAPRPSHFLIADGSQVEPSGPSATGPFPSWRLTGSPRSKERVGRRNIVCDHG